MNAQKNTVLVGGNVSYGSAKTTMSGVSSTSDSFSFTISHEYKIYNKGYYKS